MVQKAPEDWLTPEQLKVFDTAPKYRAGLLGQAPNAHGTRTDVCRCRACHGAFTVCPSWLDDPNVTGYTFGDGCLAETCETYDPARDIDLFFAPLADHGLIKRRPS